MFQIFKHQKSQDNTLIFVTACKAAGLDLACKKMCRGCAARKEKMDDETLFKKIEIFTDDKKKVLMDNFAESVKNI